MGLKQNINIVREVALTDLKIRYQGSALGYLWTLMKPLLLFAVMYVVFTKFLKIGGDLPNYPIYLLFGVVIWSFFAEVTSICMGSIVGKGDLIRKIYFPRILLVIANSLTSLIVFILNLIVIFIFIALSKINLDFTALWFILLVAEMYILALGVCLLISSVYVKFRDLGPIWEVSLQALFYATPIFYPITMVPNNFAKIMMLNPIAQIAQDSRYLLITDQAKRVTDYWQNLWILPYLLPFIIFIIGFFVFNKMAAKFAEEI